MKNTIVILLKNSGTPINSQASEGEVYIALRELLEKQNKRINILETTGIFLIDILKKEFSLKPTDNKKQQIHKQFRAHLKSLREMKL